MVMSVGFDNLKFFGTISISDPWGQSHHEPPAGETSSTPASHEEFLENSPQKAIP
jgi:hypothetical protein